MHNIQIENLLKSLYALFIASGEKYLALTLAKAYLYLGIITTTCYTKPEDNRHAYFFFLVIKDKRFVCLCVYHARVVFPSRKTPPFPIIIILKTCDVYMLRNINSTKPTSQPSHRKKN